MLQKSILHNYKNCLKKKWKVRISIMIQVVLLKIILKNIFNQKQCLVDSDLSANAGVGFAYKNKVIYIDYSI